MAIAYCILCHLHPDYVADLFRFLYRPEDQFIIHADRKGPATLHALTADLAGRFRNVFVMPPSPCSWASYSLVETTLRAIAFAAVGLPKCRHFVLLSEHHLPLVPPDEIAGRLVRGTSYVEAIPAEAYGPEGLDDVTHRFAMRYRELPGVGSFGTVTRDLPTGWLAGIYHGSQWVALSDEACRRLSARPQHRALAEQFADSLLPDETALQTLLYATPVGADLKLDNTNCTFVAMPFRGGTVGIEFTEESLRAARAQGCLFIRKRPHTLPAGLAAELDATAGLPRASVMVSGTDAAFAGAEAVGLLTAALADHLGAAHAGGWFEVIEPDYPGISPRCYLRVHTPSIPPGLRVVVLSEDLMAFKVAVIWERRFDGSHAPCRLGEYSATILRIRVPKLFLMREVHMLDDADHGFVTLRPAGDTKALAATIDKALQRIRVLGELTA